MKLGILCSKIRIEEKLLFHELEKAQHEFVQINPQNLLLKNGNTDFAGIDLLLNREIGQTRAELLLALAEESGIKTISSAEATRICNNKALTTSILQKASIPVPKTILAFSSEEALKAAEILGYPLVVKPISGSWGRLISKVDTVNALETILEHKQALNNPLHTIFYLQEFIEKPDRDIRVFVIGGKPVAAMYRSTTHWLTNTAKGAIPQPMEMNKELNDLVIKTVTTLGVEIAGVDVLESKNGYLILEVNATPEFHGLKDVADINLAEEIINYVVKGKFYEKK